MSAVSIPSAVSICKKFLYHDASSNHDRSPTNISQDLQCLLATVDLFVKNDPTIANSSKPHTFHRVRDQLMAILNPKQAIQSALEQFIQIDVQTMINEQALMPSDTSRLLESPTDTGHLETHKKSIESVPQGSLDELFVRGHQPYSLLAMPESPELQKLNNIKTYLEQSFLGIHREMKDLKSLILAEKNSQPMADPHSTPHTSPRRPTALSTDPFSSRKSMIRRPSNAQLYSLLKTLDVTHVGTSEATRENKSHIQFLLHHLVKQLKKCKQDILELRLQLAVSRQTFHSQHSDMTHAIKDMLDMTSHVRNQSLLNNESGRQTVFSAKNKIDAQGVMVLEKLKNLQDEIDEIKTDCVLRKCRLDPDRMCCLDKQTQKLQQDMIDFSDFVYHVKPIWKNVWEKELQGIVQEQAFLKDKEDLSIQLEQEFDSMMSVFETLQQLLDLQKKSASITPIHLQVASVEQIQQDGLGSVLNELQCVVDTHQNSTRNSVMVAIEKAEAKRLKRMLEAKENGNEFTQQVRHFVKEGCLRKTGGVDEIERKRQKQDQENIRASVIGRIAFTSGPSLPTV